MSAKGKKTIDDNTKSLTEKVEKIESLLSSRQRKDQLRDAIVGEGKPSEKVMRAFSTLMRQKETSETTSPVKKKK